MRPLGPGSVRPSGDGEVAPGVPLRLHCCASRAVSATPALVPQPRPAGEGGEREEERVRVREQREASEQGANGGGMEESQPADRVGPLLRSMGAGSGAWSSQDLHALLDTLPTLPSLSRLDSVLFNSPRWPGGAGAGAGTGAGAGAGAGGGPAAASLLRPGDKRRAPSTLSRGADEDGQDQGRGDGGEDGADAATIRAGRPPLDRAPGGAGGDRTAKRAKRDGRGTEDGGEAGGEAAEAATRESSVGALEEGRGEVGAAGDARGGRPEGAEHEAGAEGGESREEAAEISGAARARAPLSEARPIRTSRRLREREGSAESSSANDPRADGSGEGGFGGAGRPSEGGPGGAAEPGPPGAGGASTPPTDRSSPEADVYVTQRPPSQSTYQVPSPADYGLPTIAGVEPPPPFADVLASLHERYGGAPGGYGPSAQGGVAAAFAEQQGRFDPGAVHGGAGAGGGFSPAPGQAGHAGPAAAGPGSAVSGSAGAADPGNALAGLAGAAGPGNALAGLVAPGPDNALAGLVAAGPGNALAGPAGAAGTGNGLAESAAGPGPASRAAGSAAPPSASGRASGSGSRARPPSSTGRARRHNIPTKSSKAVPTGESGQFTSVFRGVTKHRLTGRFEAHFWDASHRRETRGKGGRTRGRQVYLGGYTTEEGAARAYDLAALAFLGPCAPTNHPVAEYADALQSMQGLTSDEVVGLLRRGSVGFARGASRYRGVTKHHQHGKWEARIGRVEGSKYLYLGTYESAEEAARAYDLAAVKFRGRKAITNFKLTEYAHALADPDSIDLAAILANNGSASASASALGLGTASASASASGPASGPASATFRAGPAGAPHAQQLAQQHGNLDPHRLAGARTGPLLPPGARGAFGCPPPGALGSSGSNAASGQLGMAMDVGMAMTGLPPPFGGMGMPGHPQGGHAHAPGRSLGPGAGSSSAPSGASSTGALPPGLEAMLPGSSASGQHAPLSMSQQHLGSQLAHLSGLGFPGAAGSAFNPISAVGAAAPGAEGSALQSAIAAVLPPYAQQDPYGMFAFAAHGDGAQAGQGPQVGQAPPGPAGDGYLWPGVAAPADPAAGYPMGFSSAELYGRPGDGGNGMHAHVGSSACPPRQLARADQAGAGAAPLLASASPGRQGHLGPPPPPPGPYASGPLPPPAPLSPSRRAASAGSHSHSGNGSLPGGFGAAAGAAAVTSALDPLAAAQRNGDATPVASPRYPSPTGSRLGGASSPAALRSPSRAAQGAASASASPRGAHEPPSAAPFQAGGGGRGLIGAAWATDAQRPAGGPTAAGGNAGEASSRAPSRGAAPAAAAATSSSSSSRSPDRATAARGPAPSAPALREAFLRRLSPLKTNDLGGAPGAEGSSATGGLFRAGATAGEGAGRAAVPGGELLTCGADDESGPSPAPWTAASAAACLSPLAAALLSPLGVAGASGGPKGAKAWGPPGEGPRGADERQALANALSMNLAMLADDPAALSHALSSAANGQGQTQHSSGGSGSALPPPGGAGAGAGAGAPHPQAFASGSPPPGALSTPRATRPGVPGFGANAFPRFSGAGNPSTPGTVDGDLWSALKWLEASDAGGEGTAGKSVGARESAAAMAGIRVTPMGLRGGRAGKEGAEDA